jgi:hypothetical protein
LYELRVGFGQPSCSTKLNGESLDVFTEASGAESDFRFNLIYPMLVGGFGCSVSIVNRYKIEGFDPGSE